MSFTVNLSGGGLLINRFNSSNMLKSTQEKLQRQQERDNKVSSRMTTSSVLGAACGWRWPGPRWSRA